jgi:hypothetical protein
MNFPRNRWLDVKLCGDGLGVHVLKWMVRARIYSHLTTRGLGITFSSVWYQAVVHLVLWQVVIDHVRTYADWPWNRKENP